MNTCANCGSSNTPTQKFCNMCGKDLQNIASQPETINPVTNSIKNYSSNAGQAGSLNLDDLNQQALAIESIRASNRTTHAVRALVRFFMIQLSFLTGAYMINTLNASTVDLEKCSDYGDYCNPNGFGTFLVFVIVIAGVVISSRIAWAELEHSNIEGVHSGKTLKF